MILVRAILHKLKSEWLLVTILTCWLVIILHRQTVFKLPAYLDRAVYILYTITVWASLASIALLVASLVVVIVAACFMTDKNVFRRLLKLKVDRGQFSSEADEIYGYRAAHLYYHDGDVCFKSATRDIYWGVRAVAKCEVSHRPPDEAHTCGFYSSKSLLHIRQYAVPSRMDRVVLECLYTGKVIPATLGYRAEIQYVQKVWLSGICSYLTCSLPSVAVMTLTEDDDTQLVSCCSKHKAQAKRSWSIYELRNILSTEIDWA